MKEIQEFSTENNHNSLRECISNIKMQLDTAYAMCYNKQKHYISKIHMTNVMSKNLFSIL